MSKKQRDRRRKKLNYIRKHRHHLGIWTLRELAKEQIKRGVFDA